MHFTDFVSSHCDVLVFLYSILADYCFKLFIKLGSYYQIDQTTIGLSPNHFIDFYCSCVFKKIYVSFFVQIFANFMFRIGKKFNSIKNSMFGI